MSEKKTQQSKKSLKEKEVINEELDQLLNNGISRNTPQYDLINIYRAC